MLSLVYHYRYTFLLAIGTCWAAIARGMRSPIEDGDMCTCPCHSAHREAATGIFQSTDWSIWTAAFSLASLAFILCTLAVKAHHVFRQLDREGPLGLEWHAVQTKVMSEFCVSLPACWSCLPAGMTSVPYIQL